MSDGVALLWSAGWLNIAAGPALGLLHVSGHFAWTSCHLGPWQEHARAKQTTGVHSMLLFTLRLIACHWPKSGKRSSLKSGFGKYIPCTCLILLGLFNSTKGRGEELK